MTHAKDNSPRSRRSGSFCGRTRREFLTDFGAGFASVALTAMLSEDGFLHAQNVGADGTTPYRDPLSPKAPHSTAKAKNVIFLYMYGGPSQIDTFDYKPNLIGQDNKTVKVNTFGRGGKKNEGRIVEPRWKFRRHGESGQPVSSLFPHLAKRIDDLAFIHSMTAKSPLHGSAMLEMNTGRILSGAPSIGSWVNYGLGTMNRDLPGYVVMLDPRGGPISGEKNWSSGFMPAVYQGTTLRPTGVPILDLAPPEGTSRSLQRHMLDALGEYNREHSRPRFDNSNLEARIASYELAYRMQSAAPEATDLSKESKKTRELYGLDQKWTASFGGQCLLARRLVERGVRFVQIFSGGAHISSTWDAHDDLVENHSARAREVDQPIAALIQDLQQRGLLEDTLIVWGGEFGRQPTAEYEKGTGRDHNSYGFTMWMAGGGIQAGQAVGATDELGNEAVEDPYEVKHLHATMLHQLGFDAERLTYFHAGLDQKLVGPAGAEPIWQLV